MYSAHMLLLNIFSKRVIKSRFNLSEKLIASIYLIIFVVSGEHFPCLHRMRVWQQWDIELFLCLSLGQGLSIG